MRLHTIPHPALPLTWWVQSGTTTVGRIKRWDTDAQMWSFQNPDGVPFGVHVASHLDDPEGALAAFERRSEWRAYLPTPDAAPVAKPVATVPIPAGTELRMMEPPTPAQALTDLTQHFNALAGAVEREATEAQCREAEAMRCEAFALCAMALAEWWRDQDVGAARDFLAAHTGWEGAQCSPNGLHRPAGVPSLNDRALLWAMDYAVAEAVRDRKEAGNADA